MKSLLICLTAVMLFITTACQELDTPFPTQSCQLNSSYNEQHPLSAEILSILDKATKKGIPGIVIAIKTQSGFWTGTSGFASLETQTLMQPCHLQYSQSVTKTYLAVLTLKLAEQGKLNLDTPISNYLSEDIQKLLPQMDVITPKMLMNHTSGLEDYVANPDYIAAFLNNPTYAFRAHDLLRFIARKDLRSKPGTKYFYSNTNALVLSLVVDRLDSQGRGHATLLNDIVLQPLQLKQTFYKQTPDYLEQPQVVNTYWDRFSNGHLENVSLQQRKNVAILNGDDGLVATPLDFVKFMDAIVNSSFLSNTSKEMMQTWIKNEAGENESGLGLLTFTLNDKFAFGHGGAGLGAGCALYYFPHNGNIVFIGTNMGTLTESPIGNTIAEVLDEISKLLTE